MVIFAAVFICFCVVKWLCEQPFVLHQRTVRGFFPCLWHIGHTVLVTNHICIDQPMLSGWRGKYHTDHLHLLRSVFLMPILDRVEQETQVNIFFFNSIPVQNKNHDLGTVARTTAEHATTLELPSISEDNNITIEENHIKNIAFELLLNFRHPTNMTSIFSSSPWTWATWGGNPELDSANSLWEFLTFHLDHTAAPN